MQRYNNCICVHNGNIIRHPAGDNFITYTEQKRELYVHFNNDSEYINIFYNDVLKVYYGSQHLSYYNHESTFTIRFVNEKLSKFMHDYYDVIKQNDNQLIIGGYGRLMKFAEKLFEFMSKLYHKSIELNDTVSFNSQCKKCQNSSLMIQTE